MTELDRYAPVLVAFYAMMAVAAFIVGGVTWMGESPVTPELYGPLVYALPAFAWVLFQIISCFVCVLAITLRKPLFVMIASVGYSIVVAMFGVMSLQAGASGVVLMAHGIFVALPIGLLTFYLGHNARRNGR